MAMVLAGPCAYRLHLTSDRQLITQLFIGWMVFLMPYQEHQSTEGNRMLICQHQLQAWRMWTLLNKLLFFIHHLWQGVNRNQQSAVKTACACISLCTAVLCSAAQNSSDNLRCCLLEERDSNLECTIIT